MGWQSKASMRIRGLSVDLATVFVSLVVGAFIGQDLGSPTWMSSAMPMKFPIAMVCVVPSKNELILSGSGTAPLPAGLPSTVSCQLVGDRRMETWCQRRSDMTSVISVGPMAPWSETINCGDSGFAHLSNWSEMAWLSVFWPMPKRLAVAMAWGNFSK